MSQHTEWLCGETIPNIQETGDLLVFFEEKLVEYSKLVYFDGSTNIYNDLS